MIARHDKSTAETCEWAALQALEALSSEERTAYQEHLAEGCPVCRSDLRAFEQVVAELGLAAEPVQSTTPLKERLLARLAAESDKKPEPARETKPQPQRGILLNQGGLLISRPDDAAWEPAPIPGIFSKLLFEDPQRRYATQLVRMEAGTTYPSHRHTQVEELFLIEGDLWVEGQKMSPGDYCRGEPESVHNPVHTESGAIFLVRSSPQDEILA